MAKGYWIAHVDVADPDGYKAYMKANSEAFRKYGARFVVRGGQYEVMEGKLDVLIQPIVHEYQADQLAALSEQE